MIIKKTKSLSIDHEYSSFIINAFLTNSISSKSYKLFSRVLSRFLIYKVNLLPLVLFLFIIFLPIAPSSQIQLSNISSQKINLSQSQYGIVFLSFANLLLVFLAFFLVRQYNLSHQKIRLFFFELVLLFFLIISEISILNGVDLDASSVWLLKFILSLSVYFVFSRLNLNRQAISFIVVGLLGTIFLEGIISFFQFIYGGVIGIPLESVDRLNYAHQAVNRPIQYASFRVVGTLSHPNYLTNYLALLLPIAVLSFLSPNKWYRTGGHLAFFACIFTSLIALSRWGLVSCIFAYATTIFLLWRYGVISIRKIFEEIKIDFLAIVLIFSVMVISGFGTNRFLSFSLEDNSLLTREELVDQSVQIIRSNPLLGVGGGGFLYYFANYDFTESDTSTKFLAAVHNFQLLIATEQGLTGLLIVSVFSVTSFFFILHFIRFVPEEKKQLSLVLFASYITFFFNSLMTMRSFGDRVGILFFLMLGLLINILSKSRSSKVTNTRVF